MVENPRQYMPSRNRIFYRKQSLSVPEKWTKKKGIPRAVKKKQQQQQVYSVLPFCTDVSD